MAHKKFNIPYEGEMWSLTDLADYLGLELQTLKKRVKVYPAERWAEPVKQSQSRKQKPKKYETDERYTPSELDRMKGYSDWELFQLYRRFRDEPGALRRLADFMASDTRTAKKKVLQWQQEGRL